MNAVRGLTNVKDAVYCVRLITHVNITAGSVFILEYGKGSIGERLPQPIAILTRKGQENRISK